MTFVGSRLSFPEAGAAVECSLRIPLAPGGGDSASFQDRDIKEQGEGHSQAKAMVPVVGAWLGACVGGPLSGCRMEQVASSLPWPVPPGTDVKGAKCEVATKGSCQPNSLCSWGNLLCYFLLL